MIIYVEGTVFNTPAMAMVNTVNTMGVMGAGIALEFALRYPKMFKEYKERCKRVEVTTGKMDYHFEEGHIIVNFPTKRHYRYDSKLEWIEAGLANFVETYKEKGITSVAFSKLGTFNGRLEWEKVRPIMEKYLSDLDADVYICLDNISQAEGKEKEMVDLFNESTRNELLVDVKMKEELVDILLKNQPIRRFWELSNIEEIKGAPYKKLFKYFYKQKKDDGCVQMTLFDSI